MERRVPDKRFVPQALHPVVDAGWRLARTSRAPLLRLECVAGCGRALIAREGDDVRGYLCRSCRQAMARFKRRELRETETTGRGEKTCHDRTARPSTASTRSSQ